MDSETKVKNFLSELSRLMNKYEIMLCSQVDGLFAGTCQNYNCENEDYFVAFIPDENSEADAEDCPSSAITYRQVKSALNLFDSFEEGSE